MGKRFSEMTDEHIRFIEAQKIFFVATAAPGGRVNVSPKGIDSFHVASKNRVLWLNLTGSGNETSAHVQADPRMTIMFCAFEGPASILRLYGAAKVVHRGDKEWGELAPLFKTYPGARQIFDVSIELVQTTCGMGVPNFSYLGEREGLVEWAAKKGEAGLKDYWREKNATSIDGLPTNIIEKSG